MSIFICHDGFREMTSGYIYYRRETTIYTNTYGIQFWFNQVDHYYISGMMLVQGVYCVFVIGLGILPSVRTYDIYM